MGKIKGLLKNAHTLKGTMVYCVALQTEPLNVCRYTLRDSVIARFVPEHF